MCFYIVFQFQFQDMDHLFFQVFIFYREQDLCLANREYEVLLYLAEHPDRDITFEELGTALFGVYRESDRRSVMVNVSRLRKRFEGNYELENRIETVWSKGYRFLKGGI